MMWLSSNPSLKKPAKVVVALEFDVCITFLLTECEIKGAASAVWFISTRMRTTRQDLSGSPSGWEDRFINGNPIAFGESNSNWCSL